MTMVRRFVALAYLLPATLLAATFNEIAQAVRDLGAPDSKSREAATKFLATAGKEAIPTVQAVAESDDPEIRLRAQELLPTVRFGLPLGSLPTELCLDLVDYPKTNVASKIAIIKQLLKLGRPARTIVIDLARSEPDLDIRYEIFRQPLEPFSDDIELHLGMDKLSQESVTHVLEVVEFGQAVLPELWSLIAMRVVHHFDVFGQQKVADVLFERAYQQIDELCSQPLRNADRHDYLAWFCAVNHRRLDDGLKHIEKALAAVPNHVPYLYTQAELYFQKDDKDRALELIGKCVERSPEIACFRKQQERMKKGDKSVPTPDSQQP